MKILAIDTTGKTASTAIIKDNQLIVESTLDYKLNHSQTILPMIAHICQQAEVKPADMDYIACANGPGSFTGLRIGAATAKGLAFALNKRIVPVPTLDALAYNIFETEKIICPIMDARRNQVYCRFYRWQNRKLTALSPMIAEDMNVVINMALEFQEEVIFLGDGVAVHKEKLEEYKEFIFAPASCSLQRASSVASLAMELVEEGKTVSSREFELIYLRKPQAEREREERLKLEEAKCD